jgi:serine-type D-Ala-D-Ala endopeptidase (penicillin-binding protein 7)
MLSYTELHRWGEGEAPQLVNRAHFGVWAALAPLALASLSAWAQSSSDAPPPHHHHHHRHRHALVLRGTGPQLRSTSALVMDTTDSTVLYARRADVAQPIASISKLLTALVVVEGHQPLDEVLEITRDDCAIGRGAYSRLRVGTRLTRGDLLHLALMSSENRAAHALARNYPGGMPAFVRAMNAKARALGMTSARFVEPTGLSSENVASAEDLSKLVAAASQNEVIREYSTDRRYAVRVGRHEVEFRNTDSLVSNPAWDIIVQKTGYIAEAGRCLVMQAVIEGRSVVIVLLNSFGKYTRVADARRVRRWMETKLSQGTARAAGSTV